MEDMKKLLDEVNESLDKLGKQEPEFMKGFMAFMEAAEKPNGLDKKQKELIAIALSVTAHCKWCIAFHVKNALDVGAKKEEIMDVCKIAALMGGGPALMYVQLVMKAIEDFS